MRVLPLRLCTFVLLLGGAAALSLAAAPDGNRLTYLNSGDPYYSAPRIRAP